MYAKQASTYADTQYGPVTIPEAFDEDLFSTWSMIVRTMQLSTMIGRIPRRPVEGIDLAGDAVKCSMAYKSP